MGTPALEDCQSKAMSTQGKHVTTFLYYSYLGQNVICFKSLFHLPAEWAMRERGDSLGQILGSLQKPLFEMPFLGCLQQQRKYLQFSSLKLFDFALQESLELTC